MADLFKRRQSAVQDTGKGDNADGGQAMNLAVRYSKTSSREGSGRTKRMRLGGSADSSLQLHHNHPADSGTGGISKLFGWRQRRKQRPKSPSAPSLEGGGTGSNSGGFVEVGSHDFNLRRRDIHLHARSSPSIFLTESTGDWLSPGNTVGSCTLTKQHQNKLRRRSRMAKRKASASSNGAIATEARRHRRRRRRSGLWRHVRRVFLIIIYGVVALLFTVLLPLALQIFKMIPAMSSVSEKTRYLLTAVQRNFQSAFALTIPEVEEKPVEQSIAMGKESHHVIEPGTGFTFEKKLRFDSQGKELHLMGTGMKGVRVLTRNIKIYGFGIYMDLEKLRSDFQENTEFGPVIEPMMKEKAISDGEDEVFSPRKATKRLTNNRSFGSLDELQQRSERIEKAKALVDSDDFYASIIDSQAQMTARLVVYFQNLKMEQVRKAFRNSLSVRIMHYLPEGCSQQGHQCVQDLMDIMTDSYHLKKGTIIDFQRSSDGTFSVIVDNHYAGQVKSEALCRAFFDIYIGVPPTTEESRRQVGRSVASFLMNIR